MDSLQNRAAKNLSDILKLALCVTPPERVIVIYDTGAPLTAILVEGYRQALPTGEFIDFNATTPEEIKRRINVCTPGDTVILVQSTNFRLNEFRFRIELFQRGLKTIEHMHLDRMSEDQFEDYIDALAYDPEYYRTLGQGLKTVLDSAQEIVVTCEGGTTLAYAGGMEDAKLNVGGYADMKNKGGTFPIGEVFTEPKDLARVNGEAMIFAFAGEDHKVRMVTPFKVIISNGILAAPNAPAEFQTILNLIRADEEVMVREFGLGLNPALGKHAVVNDITAFERQKGMHMSLGAKHGIYAKQGIHRKKARYHVDVFVDIATIMVDQKPLFANGDFVVSTK